MKQLYKKCIWAVYGVGVRLVRDLASVMEFGVVGRWGKCCYVYMRKVIGRFVVSYYVWRIYVHYIYTYIYVKIKVVPEGF